MFRSDNMVNLRKTALCTAAIILVLLTSVFFAYAAETEVNCEHTDSEFDYICDLCGEDLLIKSGYYGSMGADGSNIEYKLHYDGTLTFNGTGYMYNQTYTMGVSAAPWRYLNVRKVIISDGISSIGYGAFYNCKQLSEVVMNTSITWVGDYAFYGCEQLKSISFPESDVLLLGRYAFSSSGLERFDCPVQLSYIPDYAFSYCESLKEVKLTSSVTKIGTKAFYKCTALTGIDIPSSVSSINSEAFGYCTSLKELTIPETVDSVDYSAFKGCAFDTVRINGDFEISGAQYNNSCLQGDTVELIIDGKIENINKEYMSTAILTITEGAKTIGDGAFNYSRKMTEVNLPEGLETIGESAFSVSNITKLDLPSSLKLIDAAAFQDCSALEEVHFSESLTEIGNVAFANCVSLKAIEIPESVKVIGEETFEECTALTDVILNEGIESIGRKAFFMCGIKNLSLPASLKDIGDHAFTYNFDLENITVSENNKLYCAENCIIYNKDKTELVAFCNYYDEKIVVPDTVVSTRDDVLVMGGENMLVEHDYPIGLIHSFTLKEIVFEGALKEIGVFSFAGCINLEKVVLAENTERLGAGAFCYCLGIEEIDLPESIKYIEGAAFAYCHSLKGIKLPDNVKLGTEAFSYCSSLSDVDLGEGISALGWITFAGCGALEELIIPESLKCIENGAFGYADDPEGFCLKKITFLGTDTVIGMDYDYKTGEFVEDVNGDVLPEDCVIYGYKGSTAEEYALAFDREFVAIECQDEHSFNEPEELTKATCTEKGSAKRVCNICKYEETIELAALGHSFGEWYIVSLPDCSSQGKEVRDCLNDNCDYSEENILPVIADAHLDENADGVCDKCEEELEDNKTEPTHCDHLCHSSDAFMSFIWKIVRFFWKLFSMNPTCSCGAAHY